MNQDCRIHILHVITTLNVGGAEGMLLKLLSGMDKTRFSNQVISLTDVGPIGKRILAEGIPVYGLCMPNGKVTIDGLLKFWKLVHSYRPSILQTWLYHADLLGLILGKLARVSRICWNIRCSYHDLAKYKSSTRWTLKLCAMLSSMPDVVIANSRKGQEFHTELGYKAKQWRVIPNGFDLERFKPNQLAKPKLFTELTLRNFLRNENNKNNATDESFPILIGLIARYDPTKDHATFIKATFYLLEKNRDVHFILVGKDVNWANRLMTANIPTAWKKKYSFLGERDDVEVITAALDIATCSSYGEGFPNVVCEAMACEVPCVVTDVGDCSRIIGNTGRVVPAKQPRFLARAWEEMIDIGEEGRRRLGVAARRRVKENFELSRIVEKYEEFYASLSR